MTRTLAEAENLQDEQPAKNPISTASKFLTDKSVSSSTDNWKTESEDLT